MRSTGATKFAARTIKDGLRKDPIHGTVRYGRGRITLWRAETRQIRRSRCLAASIGVCSSARATIAVNRRRSASTRSA